MQHAGLDELCDERGVHAGLLRQGRRGLPAGEDRTGALSVRRCEPRGESLVRPSRVEGVELLADHTQRQVPVPLLTEHVAQTLDVGWAVLAVAARRPPRLDQTLLLEEPKLGRSHRGELRAEVGQNVRDAHRGLARDAVRPRLDQMRPGGGFSVARPVAVRTRLTWPAGGVEVACRSHGAAGGH